MCRFLRFLPIVRLCLVVISLAYLQESDISIRRHFEGPWNSCLQLCQSHPNPAFHFFILHHFLRLLCLCHCRCYYFNKWSLNPLCERVLLDHSDPDFVEALHYTRRHQPYFLGFSVPRNARHHWSWTFMCSEWISSLKQSLITLPKTFR